MWTKNRLLGRVAQSARSGGRGSSIAKDLIDSEGPKYTLLCHEIAFVYTHFLRDDIPNIHP